MGRGFDLEARLQSREERGLRRELAPVDRIGPTARRVPDPGADVPAFDANAEGLLVFATNDYLGLAGDDRLAEAAARIAHEFSTGAGASRLVVGDTFVHRDLEHALAKSKETKRALVFSSGYAANIGTITALAPDVVFSDELNHASIIDGCRLSDAEIKVYDHCSATDLRAAMDRRACESDEEESWLVVTDSVFSMDGDIAPLSTICSAAEHYGAWMMVDEAHATGVYDGGVVGQLGLEDRVHIQLGTLSKALGSQGGFVAGNETLIEYIANTARSFVFSTGLAPPAAGAAQEALRIAQMTDRPRTLQDRADHLRSGLKDLGFEVLGETHILPVLIGDRENAVALDEALRDRGVLAPAIRPPTVPEGMSRLRVAPTATHTSEQLDRCLDAFEAAGEEVGLR
ncbi:aminotransferase class I/II-fold pyridoxal phosphate-dependent enzyme [Halococcus thailandensis]|jgi:8-amino-7-oxononanoate synthase|uniref:8-amino-7-oxononanoate synthase n=1 Tax=Halococcus thailandensis JCM 13552 TaxID=1227457 RepID=M0ND66_9EURY|nr:8-amino-7-oxononanoate synthase [Halococcus thailandensis]EMA55009.1 7-keto-8-aminopelargonate synthetase-like enzyme [Halococcus thailandensis JCM 13552]